MDTSITKPVEKKLYFGGLDSLRAYAFFIVFISHAYFSFFLTTEHRTKLFAHGEVGVHMFFILSAFLITYLSLREYARSGRFSIIHFFKKRIVRIWPLYFLVLGASYLWHILRASEQTLGCASQFVYFLGNVCVVNGVPNSVGSTTLIPMWSISVEQQFYTIFPFALLTVFVFLKKIQKIYIKYIVFALLFALLLMSLYLRFTHANDWEYISYSSLTVLPGFICGALLAYAVYKKTSLVKHVKSYPKVYAVSALISFIAIFYVKFMDSIGVSLYILPIVYTTSIYIILATGNTHEYKKTVSQYLGKISYGLYAYHMFAIVYLQYLAFQISPLSESLLALGITIGLAHISYRYFESWFLKFK